MNKIRRHFDSVTDYCSVPFEREDNRALCSATLWRTTGWVERRDETNWLGTKTRKTAADRATLGWPAGADRVQSLLEEVDVPLPVEVKRRLSRADQGDDLDIHSVYRGDLDHAWSKRTRQQHRARRIVRLVAQTNLLGVVKVEDLFWRGAAVARLADLLTNAGYVVEIVGAMASIEVGLANPCDWLVTIALKDAQSPLDLPGLAGVICNAGFHRTWGFRAYCAIATWGPCKPGRASSDENNKIIPAAGLDADGTPTFIIPYGVKSQGAATGWIRNCVKQLAESV